MPYSVPRNPAPLDKSKNFPGIDTSEITMRTRIITAGSFVSNNNILNTQKSVQQAYQAIRSTNQGNIFQQTALTRSLLANNQSVPSSPTDLTTSITNISSTNCDCTVSWSAPSSGGDTITGYTITGSPDNLSGTTDGSITTFTFTGLLVNTLYTFTVTASNRAGPSFPATVTVTTPAPPSSPTALVTSITNISSTNCDCTVSWSAPTSNGGTAITGYTITGSPDNLSGSTNASTRTFAFTGLSVNTLYTFTVTAINIVGTSVAATVTVIAPPPSSPTALVTSIDTDLSTYINCTVSWSVPTSDGGTAITGYTITGSPGNLSGSTNASTRTFTFTELSSATLYTFTVTATNIVGTSVAATVTVTTPVVLDSASSTNVNGDVFITQTSLIASNRWTAEIRSPTGNGTIQIGNITSDSNGNLTLAGYFINEPTIVAYNKNGTPFGTSLANTGSYDTFIVQYSSTGSVNWIAQIGGSGPQITYAIYEIGGRNVLTDSSGNINILGYFYAGTLIAYNANGTPFATTLVGVSGNVEVFVAQYSSTGSVNWIARIGGAGYEDPYTITTISSNGDVTFTGTFSSPTLTAYNKDGTTGATLALVGAFNNFSATYTSSGYVTALSY